MWTTGVFVVVAVLFLDAMLMFGPAADDEARSEGDSYSRVRPSGSLFER